MSAPVRLTAVDAHVAGGVVRLVTAGLPAPRGRSIDEKARWLHRHRDDLCRALVLEPRGHAGVTLAILCEPVHASADAGLLFRRAGGFVPLSGHGVIGAAILAREEGLLHPRRQDAIVIETGLGPFTIHVDAASHTEVPRGARWTSPPSFVLAGALPIALGRRSLDVDVAWGGAFYAIVDSEAVGLPLVRSRWPEFARLARPIAAAVESTIAVTHPEAPARKGIAGVVFVGAPDPRGSQLRCLVAWSDGTIDRSASGTGAAALLAVFEAMGFGAQGEVQIEGLGGVPLTARVAGRSQVETIPAVHVEITAAAWTIARHEFVFDAGDPLRAGLDW